MKKFIFTFAFVLFYSLTFAQEVDLTFLLGNWEMRVDQIKYTEHWRVDGKVFHGKSHRVALGGDSTLLETVEIKKIDNDLYFCVTGEGNTGAVHFKLISSKDGLFIFENKTHDYPQRIFYQNKGKDELLAWIEGEQNGKSNKIEFRYQRPEKD